MKAHRILTAILAAASFEGALRAGDVADTRP
jgi:hypothetical protein